MLENKRSKHGVKKRLDTSMDSDEVNEILAMELAKVAERDYEASKTLLEKGLYPQAAFMLQQSLEKTIKAILLKLGLVKARELKKRISHAIVMKSLELVIHRTIMQFISLIGQVLELLNEIEKRIPEKHREIVSDIRNEIKDIIADTTIASSTLIEQFKRSEKDLLKSMEKLRELAFARLDNVTRKILQEVVSKASSISILDLLSEEVNELRYRFATIIDKIIPVLPKEKRQQLLNMSSEMVNRAVANVILAFYLFILIFWYLMFEPNVSSLRYPSVRVIRRRKEIVLRTPLTIDENAVIIEWCKEVIQYIDNVAMLVCIREFIEGKVRSSKCLELVNAIRKYLDIVTTTDNR